MNIVESNLSELKKLSINAPENYLNKCCLIEAEMAVLANYQLRDTSKYEKSIKLSKEHCFLNEEAIACERTAIFLLRSEGSSFSLSAKNWLIQACKCYESWGAESKKQQLLQKYDLKMTDVINFSGIQNVELQIEDDVSILSNVSRSASATNTSPKRKRAKFS